MYTIRWISNFKLAYARIRFARLRAVSIVHLTKEIRTLAVLCGAVHFSLRDFFACLCFDFSHASVLN